MHTIYLDNAASTPIDPRVLAAMTDCLADPHEVGNPSSTHVYGQHAAAKVEAAPAPAGKPTLLTQPAGGQMPSMRPQAGPPPSRRAGLRPPCAGLILLPASLAREHRPAR